MENLSSFLLKKKYFIITEILRVYLVTVLSINIFEYIDNELDNWN